MKWKWLRESEYELRKVFERVFDKQTLMALYKASRKGFFDRLTGIISIGKEANVYHGYLQDKEVTVKIYCIEACEFKNMERYIKGDPRFHGWKNRRQLIYMWAKKEFHNLRKVYQKIKCPEPIGVHKNVLVMSFIGENGKAAPKLKEYPPEKKDAKRYFETIINYIKEMYSTGLIHADLSEYNILNWNNEPWIIDLSTGVLLEHPLAEEFLRRDIRNICKFFSNFDIKANEEEVLKFVKGYGEI